MHVTTCIQESLILVWEVYITLCLIKSMVWVYTKYDVIKEYGNTNRSIEG